MNPAYRWSVEGEPYRYLTSLPKRRRRLLERSIEGIAAHPFREPTFTDRADDGSPLDTVEAEGHLITYHAEHAVRRIRVVEIVPLS